MKSMPSSGKRLRVRIASAMSSGGPQTRGPVMRMAPKPKRWISMSPPILKDPDLPASSFVALIAHPARCVARKPASPAGVLALLGSHHVDGARYKRHPLTPTLGAFRFRGLMLSDGLNPFKLLPAFLATILVGRHVSIPTAPAAYKAFYGRHLTWRSPSWGS